MTFVWCPLEYFRCQGNGRFADVSNCRQGRYFECVYFGQRTGERMTSTEAI